MRPRHHFERLVLLSTMWVLASGTALSGCSCDSADPQREDAGSRVDASGPDGNVPDGNAADGNLQDMNIPPECGDGTRTPMEACDDGNNIPADGCAPDCRSVDENYLCPVAGRACVRVVTCGNARIEGAETCDDGDDAPGDGCSAICRVESGWTCPTVGAACVAAACGDGIVAGFEACDDGGSAAPGCSVSCQLQEGYFCPTAGAPCEATTCGDEVVQGTEECDDGNPEVGDGCNPFCKREPDCADGVCVAVCGDGLRWAPEACDDGNTVSGDGCSANCRSVEQGFSCVEQRLPNPPSVSLPVTYRDFRRACTTPGNNNGYPMEGEAGAMRPYGHPDFDCFDGSELQMVSVNLSADGKPQYNAGRSPLPSKIASADSFSTWYRTDADFNRAYAGSLLLPSIGGGAYRYDTDSFFPLTERGLDTETCGGQPCEVLHPDGNGSGDQNFFFTSEVRFWFEYAGNEVLAFSGDDDVWVFIDGQLVVDIGGIHSRLDGTIDIAACNNANPANNDASCISDLGLVVGGIYEAVVFQAERHLVQSQYRLTLTNFNQAPSQCRDMCGDGIVSSREACDLGPMNGLGDGSAYDGCSTSCAYEPYCGDGVVDSAFGETCDDGINLGAGSSSCAPGCQGMGARCGDGVVQIDAGEQCDDGNSVEDDGCSMCVIEFG